MATTRTLIVLTSHDRLGDTGKPTGAYLSEISHVYDVLRKRGIEIDFVSPKGGQVPLDGVDRKDPVNAAFLDSTAVTAQLAATLRPDQVDASRYGAIFFAGGHGTMWDLPDDPGLPAIAASIYDRGGVVAAVCHGPAGLVNIVLGSGAYLVAGKKVAAFTNDEEAAVGLTSVVPFSLADKLVARGALHQPAANWQANVVVSDRLVTGQNPQSAKGVGEAIAGVLASSRDGTDR